MRKMIRILLIPTLLLLGPGVAFVGCGGGGGGGGGPGVGGQNTDFSVGGVVAGLEGTLILQNNGGDDLTIQADGPFTFATVLAKDAAYNVTVLSKSPIQNVAVINGNGKINNVNITNINVVCTDRWMHPLSLVDNMSPDGQGVYDVSTAIDAQGNALVVWRQSDGSNSQVFKSEYTGRGWTHPSDLFDNISPDGQDVECPCVAMNAAGDAVIAWSQHDGTHLQVFVSQRSNGIWSHPADLTDSISPPGKNASDVGVAMDDNGDAILVWSQSDSGNQLQIFMSEYRGGSWTHPLDLDDNISPDPPSSSMPGASAPHVAMADNGEAVIVWRQSDGFSYQVFKREFREAQWIEPIDILDNISPSGETTYEPRVATNNSGETLVVWRQSDGNNSQAFKSEFR